MTHDELLEKRAQLLGSLLLFTRTFYELRTNREFVVSQPIARESHHITICKALTRAFNHNINRLMINCPPRYGKSELCAHFVAWCLAHHPDCNFIYVSYSYSLAKKQTHLIRQIVSLPEYRELFGVEISRESSAKDDFETTMGGSVYAAGAAGTITGRGAGIQGIDRFGGAIIIDDIHKPDEVFSDTIRESIKEWYLNTLRSRCNNPSKTPIVFIGQRLHEDDLAANLLNNYEGRLWDRVVLPAIDEAGNALNPAMHSKEELKIMEDKMVYEYWSQYQQEPQPAGGGIFKPEWFVLLDEEPKVLFTFIDADTAETDKTYNDATVFSFWGIYKIEHKGFDINTYAIHWIDCVELRCEPKDLETEFMSFYAQCLRYPVQPKYAAIEKKSTGVTLASNLKTVRGLTILDIKRDATSKTQRFLYTQPYVSSGLVSLPTYGKHTAMCLEHMRKITANQTHRFDDIADTLSDAVKIALIDKLFDGMIGKDSEIDKIVTAMAAKSKYDDNLRRSLYGYSR